MSPLLRLSYTKKRYKLRLIIAKTKYRFNQNEIDDQLVIEPSIGSDPFGNFGSVPAFEPVDHMPSDSDSTQLDGQRFAGNENNESSPLSDFHYKSRFIRVAGEFDLIETIKVFADIVHTQGEYKETYDTQHNRLSYKNTAFSIGIEHQFSHYVNLKFQYQSLTRKNEGTFNSALINNTKTLSSFGGQFELLF